MVVVVNTLLANDDGFRAWKGGGAGAGVKIAATRECGSAVSGHWSLDVDGYAASL